MRALGNKTAKLDSPAIMTIFEPEDDPEEVPDSDLDDSGRQCLWSQKS